MVEGLLQSIGDVCTTADVFLKASMAFKFFFRTALVEYMIIVLFYVT